jgi:hypothetical protein
VTRATGRCSRAPALRSSGRRGQWARSFARGAARPGPGGVRHAEDRAEILGVLDPVQRDQPAALVWTGGAAPRALSSRDGARLQQDALVRQARRGKRSKSAGSSSCTGTPACSASGPRASSASRSGPPPRRRSSRCRRRRRARSASSTGCTPIRNSSPFALAGRSGVGSGSGAPAAGGARAGGGDVVSRAQRSAQRSTDRSTASGLRDVRVVLHLELEVVDASAASASRTSPCDRAGARARARSTAPDRASRQRPGGPPASRPGKRSATSSISTCEALCATRVAVHRRRRGRRRAPRAA